MSDLVMHSFGDVAVTLHRRPHVPRLPLRAWDAADLLVLDHLAETIAGRSVLVVNDGFGALATGLLARDSARTPATVTALGDSVVSSLATADNLARNGIDVERVAPWPATATPPVTAVDVAIIKVPKTLSLLRHELALIAPLLNDDSLVVGAGMVKHIHSSTLDTFIDVLGPTTTSRATRKARLIFTQPTIPSRPPALPPASYRTDRGVEAVGMANVFGRDRLDPGARLLIETLPRQLEAGQRVLDLGCGNGVVGASVALTDSTVHVTFADESHLAVASARATVEASGLDPSEHTFHLGDGLDGVDSEFDLILNNPPFHQQHAVAEHVAHKLFDDARQRLAPGGELLVVANRHLKHHLYLRRVFPRCEVAASNAKFSVLRATL